MTQDTLTEMYVELEDIRRRLASMQHTVADAIIALGEHPITIPHATHAVIVPHGAFCCDTSSDEPEEP